MTNANLKLHQIQENEWNYGAVFDGNNVGVNLTTIYLDLDKRRKDWQDEFIKMFSDVHTHELLHLIIDEFAFEIREITEEKIIRKALGQEWNKKIKKLYL